MTKKGLSTINGLSDGYCNASKASPWMIHQKKNVYNLTKQFEAEKRKVASKKNDVHDILMWQISKQNYLCHIE